MTGVANIADYRPGAEPRPAPRPPVNIEAEREFLGALLINNAVLSAAPFLKADHFSEELHRRIFEVCASLIGEGRAATPTILVTFLGEHDVDGAGTSVRGYLARLAAEAAAPIAAADYARAIRDLAARRAMMRAAETILAEAADAPVASSPGDLASEGLGALQRLIDEAADVETRRSPGELARALVDRAHAIRRGEKEDEGISTGLPDLDAATGGGFRPGTLWILGGRPRMGKSVIGAGFARRIAERGWRDIKSGKPGVGAQLFSLELHADETSARILADMAWTRRHPVLYGDILRGALDDEQLWLLEDAQRRLGQLPLAIETGAKPSVPSIAARVRSEKARMAKKNVRLALVVIDYLKFVRASDQYRGQRVYEVGEITRDLKELAKSEGLCVMLLAQVNRLVDGRDRRDKRPGLADLRESGDLEADADVVAFIHRESVHIYQSTEYRENQEDALARYAACRNQGEIIVAKTRVGAEKRIDIWIEAGASTFAAQAPAHEMGAML